eukprot:358796-Chlamydomonas_euryale.AAC.4
MQGGQACTLLWICISLRCITMSEHLLNMLRPGQKDAWFWQPPSAYVHGLCSQYKLATAPGSCHDLICRNVRHHHAMCQRTMRGVGRVAHIVQWYASSWAQVQRHSLPPQAVVRAQRVSAG